jgi:hypothetical protein
MEGGFGRSPLKGVLARALHAVMCGAACAPGMILANTEPHQAHRATRLVEWAVVSAMTSERAKTENKIVPC